MKQLKFLFFVMLSSTVFGQPSNDNCSDAIRLCPGDTLSGTTTGATTTTAEDDASCFVPSSTIWYKFTSNSSGGNVTVHFSNLVFDPDPAKGQLLQAVIYEVPTECDKSSYLIYASCTNSAVDFDITTALACNPNTTYYVLINGSTVAATEHADCDFDISISGPGVDVSFPTVSISISNTDFCQGEDVPIDKVIAACDDTVQYDWYYNGSLLLSTTEDTFSTSILSDTGTIQLVVLCDPICNISDTSELITLNVTPIAADAGPDKFIVSGQQVTLDGSGSGSPVWAPGSSLTSTTIFTPVASPDVTTTYYLTVTNGSCTKSDEVNVFVNETIIVYSAFTPNNDAINDKWIIGNSSQFPNMEVNVYDRSGQRVFSATNYDTPDQWWDGTYKGKNLPASTYYYVIDLKTGGENDIYKGMVNIIR